MRTIPLILIAAAVVLLSPVPGMAHHAFAAEFDANKEVNLRGIVTKMDWINPHAWLYVDVKGTDGKVVNWMIELGPPNALIKRGWTKKSVPAGIEVVVVGYQAKDGAMRANGRDVTFANGAKLFAGSSANGTAQEGNPK